VLILAVKQMVGQKAACCIAMMQIHQDCCAFLDANPMDFSHQRITR
jgi:hypothetical protein